MELFSLDNFDLLDAEITKVSDYVNCVSKEYNDLYFYFDAFYKYFSNELLI